MLHLKKIIKVGIKKMLKLLFSTFDDDTWVGWICHCADIVYH